MPIVRAFGKPDLFITVTCNPNWPEIKNTLLPEQTAQDRPDLYTIEFQKCGLPHAHILFILAQEHKPKTVADYDTIVSQKFLICLVTQIQLPLYNDR